MTYLNYFLVLDVCQEIVNIAREFELLVVAEDVYNLLTYSADSLPPKRLFAYDRMSDAAYKGNVISNGTFSKILSPGARIGWMELPPRCVRNFNVSGLLLSGGATNNYTSGIVATALELDLLHDVLEDNLKVYGVSANDVCVSFHSCQLMFMHNRTVCGWLFPCFENCYHQHVRSLSRKVVILFGSYCRRTTTSRS